MPVVISSGTPDADPLLEQPAVEAEPVERALDPPEDHGLREVQEDDDEHESRGTDDEDDVDQLAANSRAAAVDPHRDLEPARERCHHPGRGPAEDEQADEAERRRWRSELLDLAGDVGAAGLGERKASMISLITSLRRPSFRSTSPKMATRTIESGTREKRTR